MGIVSSTDTGGSEFLQSRLVAFARLMALVNLAGTLASIGGQKSPMFTGIHLWLRVGGILLWLLPWLWLWLRRGFWTSTQLRLLEIAMLLASSVLSGLLGRLTLPLLTGELIGAIETMRLPELVSVATFARLYVSMAISLGLAMVVIARAGLVPSRPRYTGILTATCIVLMTVVLSLPHLPLDPPGLMAVMLPPQVTGFLGINLLVWGSLVTAVSTAVSSIVYGLHREVKRARRLGQYELEDKIGEGGMGVVYRARHAMMRRPTAVKLLLPGRDRELDLARFEREVQQTARLSHPNTITIYDYGRTQGGVFYYSMELLEGATLQRVVSDTGALPAARVLHVFRCLAGALSEAHSIDLIHRDVKPANIFLADQGGIPDTPKLLDFGLVKQLNQNDSVTLTKAQSLAGTPLYMAPESITDPDAVDGRSDLYALGAVAYFMLTGTPVFEGKTTIAVCSQHMHTPPEPVSSIAPDTPPELAAIVMSCLAKLPSDRPQTAHQLLIQLDQCPQAHNWTVEKAKAWWGRHKELTRPKLFESDSPFGASNPRSNTSPTDTIMADLSGRIDNR